jgi:hypothetical protein
VKDFLRRWQKLNETNYLPDAFNFQALLENNRLMVIKDMPVEYVKIFDLDMGGKEDVIVHNQASRRFKNEVNTGLSPDNLTFTLLKRLKSDMDSCAVIGNGPFTSDLSKDIDQSFVMRCNNFKTGEGYEKIGSRVDLNISSLYHEIVPNESVDYPILGVLPLSEMYQEFTDAKQMHFHWEENAYKCMSMGNSVFTYGDKDDYAQLFLGIARRINAFPTVGIMAIATARALNFKKIILSGFTFFESEKSHYWSDIAVVPSSHHNVQAERDLVREWIKADNTEYIIDELMLSKLESNETVEHNTAK